MKLTTGLGIVPGLAKRRDAVTPALLRYDVTKQGLDPDVDLYVIRYTFLILTYVVIVNSTETAAR
jgi:hypothetical protein